MPKSVIAYDKDLPEIPARRPYGTGGRTRARSKGFELLSFLPEASLPILGNLKTLQRCGAKCKGEGRPDGCTHS
jgi:hypothetical protein